MDFLNTLMAGAGGAGLEQIMTLLKEARKYEGKIYEFMKLGYDWQKTLEKKPEQMILYVGALKETNAFVYVYVAEEKEGQIMLVKQLHRYDIKELIEKVKKFIPE